MKNIFFNYLTKINLHTPIVFFFHFSFSFFFFGKKIKRKATRFNPAIKKSMDDDKFMYDKNCE